MADVVNRDAKEAALAKVLAREFNSARLSLLGLIPNLEPWMLDVPPEFWIEHVNTLGTVISPLLVGTYIAQATTMMEDFDYLGVDWGLVNQEAVDWAKSYTYDLVGGISATSK